MRAIRNGTCLFFRVGDGRDGTPPASSLKADYVTATLPGWCLLLRFDPDATDVPCLESQHNRTFLLLPRLKHWDFMLMKLLYVMQTLMIKSEKVHGFTQLQGFSGSCWFVRNRECTPANFTNLICTGSSMIELSSRTHIYLLNFFFSAWWQNSVRLCSGSDGK